MEKHELILPYKKQPATHRLLAGKFYIFSLLY